MVKNHSPKNVKILVNQQNVTKIGEKSFTKKTKNSSEPTKITKIEEILLIENENW